MSSSSDGEAIGALIVFAFAIAAIIAIVYLIMMAISALAAIGGLFGAFHAIRNYILAFRANVRPEPVGV
ncbi:MAG: hypothetical protein Q7R40_15280 [Phaeospirillum sp.]|nr:hypothetical protein [Phaeospirillum sp.]